MNNSCIAHRRISPSHLAQDNIVFTVPLYLSPRLYPANTGICITTAIKSASTVQSPSLSYNSWTLFPHSTGADCEIYTKLSAVQRDFPAPPHVNNLETRSPNFQRLAQVPQVPIRPLSRAKKCSALAERYDDRHARTSIRHLRSMAFQRKVPRQSKINSENKHVRPHLLCLVSLPPK